LIVSTLTDRGPVRSIFAIFPVICPGFIMAASQKTAAFFNGMISLCLRRAAGEK
jgi:hypothetical protein